jgi:hypothetical protein
MSLIFELLSSIAPFYFFIFSSIGFIDFIGVRLFFLILLILPATDLYLLHALSDLFQPSFDKVVPPSFFELGLAELVSIYNDLRELGKAPPVIDSADLQQAPEVLYLSNYARFIMKSFLCIKFEHHFILLMDFTFSGIVGVLF